MLRPYQQTAIDELRQGAIEGKNKQMLCLPTGAGKTHVAAEIIHAVIQHGHIPAFIVDRIELVRQTVNSFRKQGLNVTVIQGDTKIWHHAPDVYVCSIQTLNRRRLNKLPSFDFVIQDEAHVMHKGHIKLMKELGCAWIGLSATPLTRGLGRYFDNLVVPVTVRELTDAGYLVPVVAYGATEADLSKIKTVAGDFQKNDLSKAMRNTQLVADIPLTWLKRGENRQTLVFAVDIAHSKAIKAAFEDYGITIEHLDAYTDPDERLNMINRYRTGEIKILTSCNCLSVGFDVPEVGCIILARPTKSPMLAMQQKGRGLRPAKDKHNCIILDHAGNIERHGFPVDFYVNSLDDKDRAERKRLNKEVLPKKCIKCSYLKPPKVHECPQCGFKPERQAHVETIPGELKKIQTHGLTDRDWYYQLLGYCEMKGNKPGRAFWLYKEKFGKQPATQWGKVVMTPTEPVIKYVQSRNIAFAKGKKKQRAA